MARGKQFEDGNSHGRSHRQPAGWVPWAWTVGLMGFVVSVFVLKFWQAADLPAADRKSEQVTSEPTDKAAAGAERRVADRPPKLNDSRPPAEAPEGMAWIPGGWFWMGDNDLPDAPEHLVYVDGFWLDKHEVTNAEFARFVEATGYKTIAERPLDPAEFPTVPPEDLKPGSIVFTATDGPVPLDDHRQWWRYQPGANWRHPEGPDSTIAGRDDYPVVHVAWPDAVAFAKWAGKRLPKEAEWELAARGGLDRQPYCWGRELKDGSTWRANIWQGNFPSKNARFDGYEAAAPVGSYAANGYGLFDMSGNVWEWCADWYRPDYYSKSPQENPSGPESSFDPQEPGMAKRVQRGGSFLCNDSYCRAYKPGVRGKGEIGSATNHGGFRCAESAK